MSLFLLIGCGITGRVVQEQPEVIITEKEEPKAEVKETIKEEETQTGKEDVEKTETINEVKQHDISVFGKEGFDPKEITISKGDNVSWKNEGHRGMILLIFKDGKQYSHQNSINPGNTFIQEFNEIGLYDIYWNIEYGPVTGKLIVQERSSDVIDEPVKEPTKKKSVKKWEDYTAEQLKEDLTSIIGTSRYNISNFTRDSSHPDYIKSSDLKYHVIHTIKNKKIKTFKDFCEDYCGESWDGWQYYINMSIFNTYYPLLEEDDFSSEAQYRIYKDERILVNHTQKENVIELENGKVLEYKFWFLVQDDYGNYKYGTLSYLLIYKIYCSPNMTVFIRPRWEDFTISKGGKITEVIINWELEDDRVREEILKKANKILKACPVEKDFFDDYGPKPYFMSELLAGHWRLYYAKYFNLTRTLDVGTQKKWKDEEKYVLKEINVSFTNNDEVSLYGVGLRVTVIADGDEKNEYQYYEKEQVINELKTGKSWTKILRQKEINFFHNITVMATLSRYNADIDVRPLTITFTKEDLGFE